MFKLAAFTDEIGQDLARVCEVCREFGVEGLEIRSVWDTPVQKLSSRQVKEVARIASDQGLSICSVGSPFFKCELDKPEEIADHLDILKRCGDMAREWDCGLVRGFAFWGHGQHHKPWEEILHAFEPVPAILDDWEITLGMENEAACFVGTARHLRTLLDELNCPRIRAVWDPANHVHDPDGRNVPAWPDGYDLLKKDVVHVHVKDAAVDPDGNPGCVFMGTGQVDWKGQFQALKDDGFDGYASLETHVTADRFPEALRRRFGSLLGEGGREGASKVCLAWIQEAIEELH